MIKGSKQGSLWYSMSKQKKKQKKSSTLMYLSYGLSKSWQLHKCKWDETI